MDQAILEQEALRLPARARALLAEALLESLDDDAVREIQTRSLHRTRTGRSRFNAGVVGSASVSSF